MKIYHVIVDAIIFYYIIDVMLAKKLKVKPTVFDLLVGLLNIKLEDVVTSWIVQ